MKWKEAIKELEKVQSRAKDRTITESEIKAKIEKAEQVLTNKGIPKKAWIDCVVVIGFEPPPNAYKYKASSTYIKIVRRKTTWEIIVVERIEQFPKSKCSCDFYTKLFLSKEAIASMDFTYYI